MSDRLVSVVTCFLNAERFIEETIESVFAQIHPDWELVLVDDGSGDRSADIARRYERRHPDRVRVIAHSGGRNLGKSASRNAGVAASRGPLVLFLDADDVLLPHALRTLAGAISRTPEAAVAYGRTRMWFSWPGNPDGRDAAWDFDTQLPGPEGTLIPPGGLLATLAREDDVLPSICSAIVRREALDRVGGWEDAFPDLYDDFVLWTKLAAEHGVLVLDETLSLYRKHPGSSTDEATRSGDWSPVDLNLAQYRYLAWMERWLTRKRLGDAETWEAIEARLAPYRHPTAPVAIEAVTSVAGSGGAVRGHLDHPTPGSRARSHRVPISGWVAGDGQRALGVELVVGGRPIRQVALDAPRPDVVAALGEARSGDLHGFTTSVAVTGTAPLAIDVAAVLEDQSRVPLARVAVRREVRQEDHRTGTPSVAAIVVCRTEAAALPETIESLLAQDHRPLEVVVVDDGSSSALEEVALAYPGVRYVGSGGTGGVADARRLAIGRSQADLVTFVAPGERLHRTAVSGACARLATRPECAFAVGTGTDRPLDQAALLREGPLDGPALYRRSALEVVGGVPDAPAGADDWALQLRLARRFPGIAIADPMLVSRRHAVAPPAPESVLALLRDERAHVDAARAERARRTAARLTAAGRRRGLRRLRPARAEGRALVLLYHRVAELPADPWALAVAPERFAEQLAVLRAEAQPLSMDQLVRRAARGRLPQRAVAVTFDDGYRDNFEHALPALETAGVPATLFLTSGFVGRREELWWDELERILLSPGELPRQLRVRAGGRVLERDLGEDARYGEAAARRHAGWHVGEPPSTRRHAAYGAVWSALAPLDDAVRAAAMDELRAWAGTPAEPRASHRTLDPEDVSAVAQSSAMTLGGHTVTHPRLSAQRPARQREEIVRSKARVEELGGTTVRHFAYPFGGLRDYSDRTAALVADAGYASACATWEGTATSATDPWQLPRVQVPDVGGEAFSELLATWFER